MKRMNMYFFVIK